MKLPPRLSTSTCRSVIVILRSTLFLLLSGLCHFASADTPGSATGAKSINPQIPVARPDPPPPDCRRHPNAPGCSQFHYPDKNPQHHHEHQSTRVIYLREPSEDLQGNASYLYVAAQQKACAQNTSGSSDELNPYCVAKFKDCILQHCSNFKLDNATAAICKAAINLQLREKNQP